MKDGCHFEFIILKLVSMKGLKRLTFPEIGKILLILMVLLQISANISLVVTSQSCPKAFLLSLGLTVASLFSLLVIFLSLPYKFYYNHPIAYYFLSSLSILCRAIMVVWILMLNVEISDQFFITEVGYAGLMRTSLIFLILQGVLTYEKCKYFRTRKEADEVQIHKLIRV